MHTTTCPCNIPSCYNFISIRSCYKQSGITYEFIRRHIPHGMQFKNPSIGRKKTFKLKIEVYYYYYYYPGGRISMSSRKAMKMGVTKRKLLLSYWLN